MGAICLKVQNLVIEAMLDPDNATLATLSSGECRTLGDHVRQCSVCEKFIEDSEFPQGANKDRVEKSANLILRMFIAEM